MQFFTLNPGRFFFFRRWGRYFRGQLRRQVGRLFGWLLSGLCRLFIRHGLSGALFCNFRLGHHGGFRRLRGHGVPGYCRLRGFNCRRGFLLLRSRFPLRLQAGPFLRLDPRLPFLRLLRPFQGLLLDDTALDVGAALPDFNADGFRAHLAAVAGAGRRHLDLTDGFPSQGDPFRAGPVVLSMFPAQVTEQFRLFIIGNPVILRLGRQTGFLQLLKQPLYRYLDNLGILFYGDFGHRVSSNRWLPLRQTRGCAQS